MRAKDIMVRDPVSITPTTNVDDRHRVVGIVTQKDVLRELVRQQAPPPLNLGRHAT